MCSKHVEGAVITWINALKAMPSCQLVWKLLTSIVPLEPSRTCEDRKSQLRARALCAVCAPCSEPTKAGPPLPCDLPLRSHSR